MDDYTASTSYFYRSIITCSVECKSDESCTVFSYDADTEICELGSSLVTTSDPVGKESYINREKIDYLNSLKFDLVCEGGTSALSCSSGLVITIISATYGRDSNATCTDAHGPPQWANINCGLNVTSIYSSSCDGLASCNVLASIGTFSVDPCSGTYKYTQVDYSCN